MVKKMRKIYLHLSDPKETRPVSVAMVRSVNQ